MRVLILCKNNSGNLLFPLSPLQYSLFSLVFDLISIGGRRHARHALEHSEKVVRFTVAGRVADVADTHIRRPQQILRLVDAVGRKVFEKGMPCKHLHLS